MDLPPTIRRLVPLSALAATALFLPSAPAAQTAPGAEDPSGQGSAPAPAFAVRGPAPPDPPEMVRRDEAGGATMRATRLTEPFELDGRLDDAIYDRVPGVGGFIQALPLEGEPATEPTDVWIFYDDEAVYIAGRCWDSQPHRMVATEMRRDNFGIFNNENLAVILDTFYDRRNAFFFYMNPIGGFFDGLIADENPPNRDWTAVWDSRAARFENGWTMEMRIPFKTLRYASGGPQVWGINFRRIVRWKNELSFLTGVPTALGPRAITKISSAGSSWPGGTRQFPDRGGEALSHRRRRRDPRRRRRAGTGLRWRLRGGRQGRHHQRPDRRPHLEHRLRPGRGGRAADQPHPLQPLLSREA